MSKRDGCIFDKPQDEPLFMAIPHDSAEMQGAFARASATIPLFIEYVASGGGRQCCAKLRFRDPEESKGSEEDQFIYIWLSAVMYHPSEELLSGVFFEVPPELQKWHPIGQRLGFEADEIFDWMVYEGDHLYGGFTLRVARSKLPENDRPSYDRYVGVSIYEPLP